MLQETFWYDKKQIAKDLIAITTWQGENRPRGFFTECVYEKDDIKIVNPFTSDPVLFVSGAKIDLDFVDMQSHVAEKIMKLAILSETMKQNYFKDKTEKFIPLELIS